MTIHTDSFKLLPNWFPYKKRSIIRHLSITNPSIYSSTPSYIFYLLLIRSTTHDTRSTSSIYLVIPQPSFLKFQKRSFSYIIPSIWNALPSSIRLFNLQPPSILISSHSYPQYIFILLYIYIFKILTHMLLL